MTAGALTPVPPAGLGASEAAIVLVLISLGRDFNSGLIAAVAVRLAFALSPVALTGFIVVRERTGVRRLIGELYAVAGRSRTV